jgi:hypothetical protein
MVASNVQATLRTVQDVAERAVLRLVSARVGRAMTEGFKGLAWLPPGPLPPGRSAYVEELLDVVQV